MRANPQPDPMETPDERRARLAREAELIEEARASIAREGTIPFEEIEAWVNSWGTANPLPKPTPRT
jgi:hypothetical protein